MQGRLVLLFPPGPGYSLGQSEGLSWGLLGLGKYLSYARLHEANYAAFGVGDYLEQRSENWGLRLPYTFDYYWTQSALHRKLRSHSLLPHLRLAYAVDQDVATDEQSGFCSWEVSLGGAVPISKQVSMDVSLTYLRYTFDRRLDPYNQGLSGSELDRRDHRYLASVQLFYRPESDWQVVLGYMYDLNPSNLSAVDGFEPYDYRRNSAWLMLVWSF